jgi:hypothetical protein
VIHPASIDRVPSRLSASDPVPLAHLLACEECAGRVSKEARESKPGMRVDLYPGDECPGDEALLHLIRERGHSSTLEHLGVCLWCTLSVRHFTLLREAGHPATPAIPRQRFLDTLREQQRTVRAGRLLPPSALIECLGDALSVTSPLGGPPRRISIRPNELIRVWIRELIRRQQLPMRAPDGTPMAYSVHWKEGGRQLNDGESLLYAGVEEGHHLFLVPEIMTRAEE